MMLMIDAMMMVIMIVENVMMMVNEYLVKIVIMIVMVNLEDLDYFDDYGLLDGGVNCYYDCYTVVVVAAVVAVAGNHHY